ncbi:MAG: hypothetical protein QXE64_02305 [Candidatus Pacearchaeota archaeon]
MSSDRNLIIFSLILAIIILLLGFLLGNYIASLRLESFKESEEMLLYNIIGLEVRERMLSDLCEINEDELWKEKVELGRKLTALERKKGKNDKEVLRTKEIYEIIEIKTMMFLEKIKDECNKNFSIILFFYSNRENSSASEDQGKILDTIVYEYNERKKGSPVYVFAFSFESKNPASRFLRAKYGIKQVPSLVVDDVVLEGYQEKQNIKELLK